MNPMQHGEVFVTDDGAETDLDLGHYERFIIDAHVAAQQLHDRPDLLDRDREGAPRRLSRRDRAGHPAHHRRDQRAHPASAPRATTCSSSRSAAPSATSSRCRSSRRCASCASSWARRTSVSVHLTLVPYIAAAGELKTKPTQHSVQKLREIGIQPDVLVCRCDRPLEADAEEEDRALLQRRRRRGVHVAGRRHDLRGAARAARARGSTTRSASCSTSGRARRGLDGWAARRRHGHAAEVARCRSASSASTSSSPRATSRSTRRCSHGGIANDCKVVIRYIDSEEVERAGAATLCADVDGILVAPGLRRARHRGQDRGDPLRARAAGAVLRHLLRHAARRASSSRATSAA